MTEPARISVEEIMKRLEGGETVLFIDTRNSQAWSDSRVKIPGALRMHYTKLEQHIDTLPRDGIIVTYCT